jgi:hypothetical protein
MYVKAKFIRILTKIYLGCVRRDKLPEDNTPICSSGWREMARLPSPMHEMIDTK